MSRSHKAYDASIESLDELAPNAPSRRAETCSRAGASADLDIMMGMVDCSGGGPTRWGISEGEAPSGIGAVSRPVEFMRCSGYRKLLVLENIVGENSG